MKQGKLIVIDGTDGTGKTTQTKLLYNYLKAKRIKTAVFDFPQYNTFFGKLIARYLLGELGGLNDTSHYLSSLPFVLDRLYARNKMIALLRRGCVILANRFVSSNAAHQAAKLKTSTAQNIFLEWIYE